MFPSHPSAPLSSHSSKDMATDREEAAASPCLSTSQQAMGSVSTSLRKIVVIATSAVLAVCMVVVFVADSMYEHTEDGPVSQLQKSSTEILSLESKLKSQTAKLNQVLKNYDTIKVREKKLKHEEEALHKEASNIRSLVHEARNSAIKTKYEIHNLKAADFSKAMFEHHRKEQARSNIAKKAKLHATQPEAPHLAPHATAVKALVKQRVQTPAHASIPVVQAHIVAPPLPVYAAKPLAAERPYAAASHASVAQAAAPVYMRATPEYAERAQVELKKKTRAVEQSRSLRAMSPEYEVNNQRSFWKPVRVLERWASAAKQPSQLRMPVVITNQQELQRNVYESPPQSLDQATDSAEQNAVAAQQLAFLRSPQYERGLQESQRRQMEVSNSPFPLLPRLRPLGPEAAGP